MGDTKVTDHVAEWAQVEGNSNLRVAVNGAIGEANSMSRVMGLDENAAWLPEWCEVAVNTYREIVRSVTG